MLFDVCINTSVRGVHEVLRLTAFLLSVDDIKVDFNWLGNGPLSVRRDFDK